MKTIQLYALVLNILIDVQVGVGFKTVMDELYHSVHQFVELIILSIIADVYMISHSQALVNPNA